MRKSLLRRVTFGGLLLGFLVPQTARAIEMYGRIRGVVSDPSGAVIVGAIVTVINNSTKIAKTTTSGPDGSFEVFQLPAPSTYTVRAETPGFKAFDARRVRLSADQIYVLNIPMEVGATSEQIIVEAALTQAEKTSMQLSATIGGEAIVDMPLNERNWVDLQQTLPGVMAAADARGNYATNGSQPEQNSYLLDGIDANDLPLNTPLVIPSPDAIAEVRLVSNTMNPEYGRNSGAVLNAITKSGSNAFHGSGFEFFRDTGLNARNFFQPEPDAFHMHQFGGTVGGPLKKDKSFFFFSYQGLRARMPADRTTTVFTEAQRQGSFPGIAASDVLSPFALTGEDGQVYPAGTPYSTLFPSGQIPSADFNPLALSLMNKFVPLPNSGGTEYNFGAVQRTTADEYLTRVDYNLTSKDALWGSWFYKTNPTANPTVSSLPGFPAKSRRHLNTFSLTWNHTFSGTAFNELRLGYTRFNFDAAEPVDVIDPKSVGFTGINVQDPAVASWPFIGLAGYFTLGFSTGAPQPRLDQTRQLDDNFTRIVGTHTFKVGFSMRRFGVYNPFYYGQNGDYGFAGLGPYSTGDPGADFLLGIPDSYGQGGRDIIDARSEEYYAYFQDQWKIRKNLTLTYGTGYQIDTPIADVYHDNHAVVAWRPGQQSTLYPNAPVNYVFQGDPGVSPAAGTTKYGHFGPRFGFAWSPGKSGRWSIRGGYGIYFNKELEEQALQFLGAPPYGIYSTGVGDVGLTPNFGAPFTSVNGAVTLPNKFPYPTNPPSTVNFAQFLPTWIMVYDPNISVPYAQNFNLTVERQLSINMLLSVAYVGALGRKNLILRELNPGLDPTACAADPFCRANRVFQGFYYPEHFRYDPTAFGGIANDQTTGISNYNSLQVVFNRRMSHGLELDATFTWSHSMDNGSGFENSGFGGGGVGGFGNLRGTNPFNQTLYNYGPSSFDARRRFAASYTYFIPPIRSFDHWAAKRFFEGWRMSGTVYLQSGFPLDVVDGGFRSLTCWALTWTACWDVPNVVSSPQYADPRTSSLTNTATRPGLSASDHYWFDPNTFARADFGVQGNAGRNVLRGPGIANFDWAFMKDTRITESTRIELRFEFYNLFNHTQFGPGGISTDISSSNFGRILAARDPRLIQLAAKLYF